MLIYGVLKETAEDGETDKNSNENNRMPRWGDERAARRVRSKVRVRRQRIWNCIMGEQVLMMRLFSEKEWSIEHR
jgi:hypothetical protein